MGRAKPPVDLSPAVEEELALARIVAEVVADVASDDAADDNAEDVAEIERQLVARSDGRADDAAPAVVRLDGIEVTQEIQNLQHSVSLVAGRPTVARVYLSYPSTAVDVLAELRVSRSSTGPWRSITPLGPARLDPSRAGATPAQLKSRRADLGTSLNFLLPADLTTAGRLWLSLGPVRRLTGTDLPSLAGVPARSVTFRRSVPLRIRLVRIRYTQRGVTHEPSTTDVDLIRSWLRRAYPVSDVQLTTTTVTAKPAAPFDAAQINAQLIALRAVDVATGTDARTHYYGMVADSGFFMRGLASGIPRTARPGTVASGPTGPGGFSWDTDGSFGDWYGAHELGHTLGRFHAEFCGAAGGARYPFPNGQLSTSDGAFFGLDVGDPSLGLPMKVMDGVRCHDVMSYCDDQWLSPFTYGGIYDRLLAEDRLSAGPGRRGGPGADSPNGAVDASGAGGAAVSDIRLIASVNLTRKTGSVMSILSATGDAAGDSADADAGDPGPGADDIRVRFLAADGSVLDERPVPFLRSTCEDPDDDVTGVVDTDLQEMDGAASVALVVEGEVVDSHPVGGQATAAVGGLVLSTPGAAGPGTAADSGGLLEVRWEAPDTETSQRYIVQLSEDAGASWQTVAVDLSEPAVTISTDLMADEVTVRLLATTGATTTVVTTETIPVR